MVLPDRIELSTSPLPMECSTTELRQHARESAPRAPTGVPVLATRTPLAQARGQGDYAAKTAKISTRLDSLAPAPPGFPIFSARATQALRRTPCSTRQCICVVYSFMLHLTAFERVRHEGRSGQRGTAGRRRREGFATGPAEAGAARKSQAAEIAGEGAQRSRDLLFRTPGCRTR
jgi:hypothetical protein